MIRTDGRRTIADNTPHEKVVANADAFLRTLAEIRTLPEVRSS
jgi:hypothetical protein